MFCPKCCFPNGSEVLRECPRCHADMSGLRERVAVGTQFVFAAASADRPVALSLDGAEPQRFEQPTLISRHRHGVGLGEVEPERGRKQKQPPRPGVDLPRLPPPAGPDLTAVITDRKIYRPKEQAHIFIVAPDLAGKEVEMEVHLAGQQISKVRVGLDEAGLALRPYAGLEEGEYTVLVRRTARTRPALCTFSVAEFTLSPLIAVLEHHAYEAGRLAFRLRLLALSVPYDGPVELGLRCSYCQDQVVATQPAAVHEGIVEATFELSQHTGPFRVEVTTPAGETASVFFPGTARAERERITLCPLGRVAQAGLLPGEDTQEVRGLHVGYGGAETTPLRLESAVARTGRLLSDVQASAVQVVTFHPLSGESAVYDFCDVAAGQAVEFPVAAPYTLFTVGLLAPRQQYEAWGVVVRPVDLAATLSAPPAAEPGAEIAVRVEAAQPAACLLLVYDARLEHESPIPKLAGRLMDAIRGASGGLREQSVPALPATGWRPYGQDLEGMDFLAMPRGLRADAPLRVALAAPRAVGRARLDMPLFQMAKDAGSPAAPTVEAEPLAFVAVASREDFPELAYLELFPVTGAVERTVALGDQIGTWRCRAYLVAGLDLLELTADVEAARTVYAELDLPAIVGQGDDILASVRYHSRRR